MQQNKLYTAISLCRRAGKLVLGFDPVMEQVAKGKAFVVLLAQDTSEKTKQRVQDFCEDMVPVHTIPLTQEELVYITRKKVGVYAVMDENFAILCENCLECKEEISE